MTKSNYKKTKEIYGLIMGISAMTNDLPEKYTKKIKKIKEKIEILNKHQKNKRTYLLGLSASLLGSATTAIGSWKIIESENYEAREYGILALSLLSAYLTYKSLQIFIKSMKSKNNLEAKLDKLE